jgi:mono/diheme cytochrome c family protein
MKFKIPLILIPFFLATFAIVTAADCDMAETGKALAEKDRCAICHKEGGLAQPLAGIAEGKTDEFLKQVLLNPKEALGPMTRMPNFDYTDEQVQALIAYLRSLSKP